MTPFEKGSGLSASWLHLFCLGVSGTVFIIAAIVIVASLVAQLADEHTKFSVGIIIKLVVLSALVSFIIGIIASM